MPKTALLTHGISIATRSKRQYYRFEIPDNFYLSPGITIQCSVGTKPRFAFPVVVADIQSQFAYLLFPCSMGDYIPEMHCAWDPSEIVTRLRYRWSALSTKAHLDELVARAFADNSVPLKREPIFPSTFHKSQLEALKASVARRVSFIIGERYHGKTGVAAALLFNMIREGKRILYLASSSNGLYDCMNEVASLNPVVAEESITIVDAGLDLQPELPVKHISVDGIIESKETEKLDKLFRIIFAEQEYQRVNELINKISEKQRQIETATKEADVAKEELKRLQNLSMIDRMKQRNYKSVLDEAQMKEQHKTSLIERLQQQLSTLTKERAAKETTLPVSLKEKTEIEKLISTTISFTDSQSMSAHIESKRCVATTLPQALLLDPDLLKGFDGICIDDAHALNLPEFFYCASLASERCFVLADITEQPPRSIAQTTLSRAWLQKNYFSYFQDSDENEKRFTASSLPDAIVSELQVSERTPTIFDACLFNALEDADVPPATRGRIYFINTESRRAQSPQYIGKKKILPFNAVNAEEVIDCAKHAILNGTTTQDDIMVVTPPSGQSFYLREQLHAVQMQNVEIATLGELRLCSKRAIIFDLTVAGLDFTLRSLDERKIGTVKIADTFNSLLSTVREDLYIVADLAYFRARYKDRFITKLLETMASHSENPASIMNAARRYNELSIDVRKKVLTYSTDEKKSLEYTTKVDTAKASALDRSTQPQNSIAQAEKKQRMDVHFACLRVLAKREIINTIAQYLETAPLYKTTAETIKYSTALIDYDCENENDFKAIMDMWNLLIYETSNANKMEHPLASKAKVDAKISSDIQQIYVYYHSDLDMVVEEGKHKLAQSIQKIFNDCIGKKPVTPSDWKNAYLVFLTRMEKYLDTIVNQIRA